VRSGKPATQIENHPGEKSGLGNSEQKAQREKCVGIGCEADCGRDDSPRHGDTGQPPPGTEPLQGQVRRNLHQQVADEEDTGGKAEHRRRQLQVSADISLGDPEVGAVQVVDEVQRHDERHDADSDLPQRALFQRFADR